MRWIEVAEAALPAVALYLILVAAFIWFVAMIRHRYSADSFADEHVPEVADVYTREVYPEPDEGVSHEMLADLRQRLTGEPFRGPKEVRVTDPAKRLTLE